MAGEEFRTGAEDARTRPGTPAALLFNPHAEPASLAALAGGRAECLHRSLISWCCVTSGDVSAVSLALALEPIAEEMLLLMNELNDRLCSASSPAPVTAA